MEGEFSVKSNPPTLASGSQISVVFFKQNYTKSNSRAGLTNSALN